VTPRGAGLLAAALAAGLAGAACRTPAGGAADPASPTPVAAPPPPATDPTPTAPEPGRTPEDEPEEPPVPDRAASAPLVTIRQVLDADSLLGRRVRVRGRCAAVGGRSGGSWILEADGAAVEVRGLVPPACSGRPGDAGPLTIFAQVEPRATGSPERLLLRLPGDL
jgi:hypothetical protein